MELPGQDSNRDIAGHVSSSGQPAVIAPCGVAIEFPAQLYFCAFSSFPSLAPKRESSHSLQHSPTPGRASSSIRFDAKLVVDQRRGARGRSASTRNRLPAALLKFRKWSSPLPHSAVFQHYRPLYWIVSNGRSGDVRLVLLWLIYVCRQVLPRDGA